ncbi:T9SS type A sorting domain-containing protein, partial [Flavobacterium macrobrachii]
TICVQNYPTPANDLCSGAIALTPNTSCVGTSGTFSGSSNTGTTTTCFANSLQDVWYSFVATDPTMSITVTNGVSLNLGMEILTGSCSGASFVCDNSSTSTTNEFYLNNNFTVGQTYYVRVFQTEASLVTSFFNICVQNYPTPANDLCSGAIALTPNTSCVGTSGTFSGSSNTGTTTSCFANSLQDVWYSFVATSQTMSITVTNGVNLNLAMEILTGSCSGASFVCDNSSSSTNSEFYESNSFTIGETYYVRVFQTETSLVTSFFNICVQGPTLNIEENEINNFTIYPNPVTDFIEIDTNSIIKEVNLYTISGQLILRSNQKRISTIQLPEGIYLIRIEDENGSFATKKLIKK